MKTFYICYSSGRVTEIDVPLGTHISEIAKQFKNCNIFWIGAPLDTKPEDFSVIRYIPDNKNTINMTERQRIFALDAACCAAENISDKNVRDACNLLQDELDYYFNRCSTDDDPENFGEFLKEQLEAVELLAKSPETFGANVD